MALRFGTDGVRGVALTELTVDDVRSLGAAAARVLGSGRWLIGRDTRISGPALEAALAEGLASEGAIVELVGVVPTPALAYLAALEGLPAAMITASHNPAPDNGVKIFAAGGVKLVDRIERAIEAEWDGSAGSAAAVRPQPKSQPLPPIAVHDPIAGYVAHLVGLFPDRALAGLRLVIDCANGAMSEAAPAAMRAMGADVVVIHAEPDGTNINDGCGATSTGSLAASVVAHAAAFGLAFDGDGDRVIAVDELGRVVDGDRLIALAAHQMRAAGDLVDDTVVVTVMSNLGFRLAMEAAGIHVVETGVGDRYVLEALDRGGYALGGEQSGHIIYRTLATTGDGLLAGLQLAAHLAGSSVSLAETAAAVMTSYPQVLVNVPVSERHPAIAEELRDEVAAAETALAGEGRVLLRASGTEPLVRVMVEAATPEIAADVAARLAEVVRHRFGA